MPQPNRMLTPWASPLHTFGAEVRRRREAAGLSQEHLGRITHHSAALIGRIEKAERRASRATTRALDQTLGADCALIALWEAAMALKIHTGPRLGMRPGVAEDLRRDHGWGTVNAVADHAGLERNNLRLVADGLRQPTATFVARFCMAYDLDIDQAFEILPVPNTSEPDRIPDQEPDQADEG